MPQASGQEMLEEAIAGQVRLVRFNVEQYHEMIDAGTLPEDTRTELLDGLLVEKDRSKLGDDPMTIGDRHRIAVMRLERLLPQFEKLGCFLQCQQPVVVPSVNEPEPDIAVIKGKVDDFAERRPEAVDAIFVLEVADSSLRRDLGVKLRIYARGRIPLYIVVDLQHDLILFHRTPRGSRYTSVSRLSRGDTLKLPAGGGRHVEIAVDRLL